jgi:hypothetical protein
MSLGKVVGHGASLSSNSLAFGEISRNAQDMGKPFGRGML